MSDLVKIVVADDSALARGLLMEALRGMNVEFLEADCGNAAIRAINEHRPEIAILDINMPYPDGLALLRKIREDREFKRMFVVICSVEAGPEERNEAKRFRANGYFVKPFEVEVLRNLISKIVAKIEKKKKNGTGRSKIG